MCERGPWCQAGMLNKWIAGRKPPNSSVILNIVAKRSDVSHDETLVSRETGMKRVLLRSL